jgi:hypothetical protein
VTFRLHSHLPRLFSPLHSASFLFPYVLPSDHPAKDGHPEQAQRAEGSLCELLTPSIGAASGGDSPPFLSTVDRRLSASASPLECALMGKHRVLPGFGRSCAPASPLECAVTKTTLVTPLESALTKNGGTPSRSFFSAFAARHCKFALLFSITSTMPPPQPFSFHTFALLPGGGHPSSKSQTGFRQPSRCGQVPFVHLHRQRPLDQI